MSTITRVRVRLKNVRLSYPHLFEPRANRNDPKKKKYQATFLIDPSTKEGKKALKDIKAAVKEVREGTWGDRKVKLVRTTPLHDANEDADLEKNPDYEDMFYIAASNPSQPRLRDRTNKRQPEPEELYAGCMVNAILDIYPQDDKEHGKAVNAGLAGVQFFDHNDAFGGASVASDDDFDDYGELDDDEDAEEWDDDDDDDDDRSKPSKRRGKRRDADDDDDEDDDYDDDEDEDEDEEEEPPRKRSKTRGHRRRR